MPNIEYEQRMRELWGPKLPGQVPERTREDKTEDRGCLWGFILLIILLLALGYFTGGLIGP